MAKSADKNGIKISMCPRSLDEKTLKGPLLAGMDSITKKQVNVHLGLWKASSTNNNMVQAMSAKGSNDDDDSGKPCGIQVKSAECLVRLMAIMDKVTSVSVPIAATSGKEQSVSVIGELQIIN